MNFTKSAESCGRYRANHVLYLMKERQFNLIHMMENFEDRRSWVQANVISLRKETQNPHQNRGQRKQDETMALHTPQSWWGETEA